MVQLQENLEKIEAANAQVVGVSYDSVEVLAKFAENNDITFPLLSDDGSKTIHAFGIHNANGYPHPATFIVDKDGKVLHKIAYDGYRKRHSVEELLERLQ